MLRSAFVALALASARLPAQDAAPAAPVATAKAPDSFEFDRAIGPLAFVVRFRLADHVDSHLQIRFDEIDEPGTTGAKGEGEHEILALDFQPFEGARFVLSRSTRRQSLVSSALAQVPEPADLEFRLRFELPQEGGLSVTLPDGMPVVVATTPRAARMKVEFAASGGVVAFEATKPERGTRLAVDGAREPAFGELARRYPFESELSPRHDDLGARFLEKLPNPPAAKEVRVVDRQEVEGGILERWVVAFEESVEAPLVVVRPASDAKRPALLCVAGGPKGNADGAILRALAGAFAAGRTVASFELIGAGERRLTLPHDALSVPELELVGLSSFDGATVEALQVLQWLAGRADVDAAKIALAGAGAGAGVAFRLASESRRPYEELANAGAELADDAVRVGDDYLRLRFDSCQLNRARARREELPAPDRTVPLADRMGQPGAGPRDAPNLFPSLFPLVFSAGDAPVEWNEGVPLRKHVTIVASDRGVRVALEEWAARHPANDDETCLAFDLVALESRRGENVDPRPLPFLRKLAQLRGAAAEPPRVFADGAAALPLLSLVIESRIATTSFTASHAIPSFEILLARPHAAHRAAPELGVLSQGLPEWAFVPNALSRWEIEDAVIELIGRNVAVDWQDPVDALRRPLSRHDRLAMWPRVRHAKFAR